MIKIRPYESSDAQALAPLFHKSPTQTARRLDEMQSNGRLWIIAIDGTAVGYAAALPVPGLPQEAELEGGILNAYQRQGLGTKLWHYLLADLGQHTPYRLISYSLRDVDSPTGLFLRHHAFFVEHEEWSLLLPHAEAIPTAVLPPACTLQTLPQESTIHQFCTLYAQSFAAYPWYQPYTPAEVAATLDNPADILYLYWQNQPIGFVWLKWPKPTWGEIEPIGIVQAHQGQGYGRYLLQTAVNHLVAHGAQQIKLGVWHSNKAALALYRKMGFHHTHTLTYLAYRLTV